MPKAVGLRPGPLGPLANQLVRVGPTAPDALVLFRNKAEAGVSKLDQRLATLLAESVLNVIGHRLRHEERPADHSGPPVKASERRIIIAAQFQCRGFAFVFRFFGAIKRQDRDGMDLGGADYRVSLRRSGPSWR